MPFDPSVCTLWKFSLISPFPTPLLHTGATTKSIIERIAKLRREKKAFDTELENGGPSTPPLPRKYVKKREDGSATKDQKTKDGIKSELNDLYTSDGGDPSPLATTAANINNNNNNNKKGGGGKRGRKAMDGNGGGAAAGKSKKKKVKVEEMVKQEEDDEDEEEEESGSELIWGVISISHLVTWELLLDIPVAVLCIGPLSSPLYVTRRKWADVSG